VNKLKLFLILTLYSLAAFAEEPRILILVPTGSLDPNSPVSTAGRADCDDIRSEFEAPAVALDLRRLNGYMDNVITPDSEWEINGQRYVPLTEPERGEKMRPQVNLMESEDGYVALSARGRVEFRIDSLKGSFDGKKIKFKVPF